VNLLFSNIKKEKQKEKTKTAWEKKFPFVCPSCQRKFCTESELLCPCNCPDCGVGVSRGDEAYNDVLWIALVS